MPPAPLNLQILWRYTNAVIIIIIIITMTSDAFNQHRKRQAKYHTINVQ